MSENNLQSTAQKYKDPQRLGRVGEFLACQHLQKIGYSFIFHQWRYQRAEVDLVMLHKSKLCLIEVKTRLKPFFDDQDLLGAISYKKEQQLQIALRELWQQRLAIIQTIKDPPVLHKAINEIGIELIGISNLQQIGGQNHVTLQHVKL